MENRHFGKNLKFRFFFLEFLELELWKFLIGNLFDFIIIDW